MNELVWPVWKLYSDIHVDKMRKTIEYNRIVISCSGSNWITSEYEVGVFNYNKHFYFTFT
jgi:hypothetical protein